METAQLRFRIDLPGLIETQRVRSHREPNMKDGIAFTFARVRRPWPRARNWRLVLAGFAFSGCAVSFNDWPLGNNVGGATGGHASTQGGSLSSGGGQTAGAAASGGAWSQGGAGGSSTTGGVGVAGVGVGGTSSTVGGGSGQGGTSDIQTGGTQGQLGGASSQHGTGGTGGTGGVVGGSGLGGTVPSLGGAPSGGSSTTSGTAGKTSSATGGTRNTGGTTGTGGTTATVGGAVATGGTSNTGGMSTGGVPPTGGTRNTGGTAATGGTTATGGNAAAGDSSVDCSTPMPTGGHTYTGSLASGTADGLNYGMWTNGSGGSITIFTNAHAFAASWNNTQDFMAHLGLDLSGTKSYTAYGTITAQFVESNTGSGGRYSYIGAYGWMIGPCVEWYIHEDSNGQQKGSVTATIDGATYYLTTTTMTGTSACGVSSWTQIASIRATARQCGTINVSNHFAAWAAQGWSLGNPMSVYVNVEVGGGGTGSIQFPVANVTTTSN
jgi:hypothetical protein